MSMSDLEKALELIRQNAKRSHFMGPRPEELVLAAETALGLKFPPAYRRFVRELGAGSIVGEEFYGVVATDFGHSSIPDAVWLNLNDRKMEGLPKHIFLVYSVGEGTHYALDFSAKRSNDECPVVAWLISSKSGDRLEVVAEDFGRFLLEMIRHGLEDLAEEEAGAS